MGSNLFFMIPLFSLLCNLFLFLTVLGAKKDKLVYSFMMLLVSFMAWTGGSFCMRLSIYPGTAFWYNVSVTGVFCVPILYYHFIYYFSRTKARLTKFLLTAGWLVILALNIAGVFIRNPQIINSGGEMVFIFKVSYFAAIPVLFAVYTIFLTAKMIYASVYTDGVPMRDYRPLFLGILLMFSGTLIGALPIPSLKPIPFDTLICGINAFIVYYSLYRRRAVSLKSMASSGSSYLLAAVFTVSLLAAIYPSIDAFYTSNFAAYPHYQTFAFAVFFSLMTTAVFSLIKALMNKAFIRGVELQESAVKSFSLAINKTLNLDEINHLYRDFILENIAVSNAYICALEPDGSDFTCVCSLKELAGADIVISQNSPFVQWMKKCGGMATMREFARTASYKALWESEKHMLQHAQVEYVLPIIYDNYLAGFTLFTARENAKSLSQNEFVLLESTAAILSVAFKNASLFTSLQHEARTDSLTGLYNRGYFSQLLAESFELAKHDTIAYIVFSLDDFHLFNELYGTMEGDKMLKEFSRILDSVFSQKGSLCRFSGKEFALFLPFCDGLSARQYVEIVAERLSVLMRSTKRVLTFSAGICAYPFSASTLEELQTHANLAVFSAKQKGKNRIVLYGSDLSGENKTENIRKIADNSSQTIFALTAAIDAKDHYTFNHSNSVAQYASQLAAAINLDAEHVEIIRQAGMLHDIGKIGIPEAILSKTSRLTDEEYDIMKQHVEGSIAMIRYLPSLDYVIPAAISHHERWDGQGYPRNLKGEQIPVGGRCLAIADAFDAMISARPYRNGIPIERALDELRRNLGTQFDPDIGLTFIKLVENGTIRPLFH